MIFAHTWKNVLATWVMMYPNTPETLALVGMMPELQHTTMKTQTRRIQRTRETLNHGDARFKGVLSSDGMRYVYATPYLPHAVRKSYAVQPKRGGKSIARIEIRDIRAEDVRTITPEDAKVEGFALPFDFLATWVKMHDKEVNLARDMYGYHWGVGWGRYTSCADEQFYKFINYRPHERYQAWALSFEVVSVDVEQVRILLENERLNHEKA